MGRYPIRQPTKHVFPFLTNDMAAERERIVISQVIKITKQYMKGIAKELEIQSDVNTYSARHSFATILLQSFTAGYLNGIVSSDAKICKSPILTLDRNSSGLILAPVARTKKRSGD